MSGDILMRIAEKRRARIAAEGHTLGSTVPEKRAVPAVPFGRDPFIICEIKRRSPSKGNIDTRLDPVKQAGRYKAAGVRSFSVLTEEDHFGGSLEDLMAVKQRYPGLSVLRKEFILDEEDLIVSWRAGADAVLLIAALLEADLLSRLYYKALEIGLQPLVEIHTEADAAKARPLAPEMTGINSRDLTSFRVDALLPLERSRFIDWKTRLIFESGISWPEDVRLAREAGFAGVLIGETAVRHPERLPGLVAAAGRAPERERFFWRELARKKTSHPGRPLVKVCGITNEADLRLADELGADLVGFVFADSPRRADPAVVSQLPETDALKVGVVVCGRDSRELPEGVAALLAHGKLDALQFHGDESPEACEGLGFPYYKALRAGSQEDVEQTGEFRSPRVLIDARVAGVAGGSGVRVDEGLALKAALIKPLWLAGGLNPENAGEAVRRLAPELIDLSSGLEEAPGKKDHEKMRLLFKTLAAAGDVTG